MSEIKAVEYAVPRNPAVPAPSFGDVIKSELRSKNRQGGPAGDRVRVYRGADIPPDESSLVNSGPLVIYEKGLLFIATRGNPGWRDRLRELGHLATDFAMDLAPDFTLPVAGVVATIVQRTAAESFLDRMKTRDPREASLDALQRRLTSERTFVLPYVDIVGVRGEWVWRWRRFRKMSCTVLTLESGAGASRTYGVLGVDADLAGQCLRSRFEQEFAHFTREVWRELLDLEGVWQSLIARYPDLATVPVGRVWDDWKATVEARMAARAVTQARVASIALERLGSWLAHYRRIPPVVPSLQIAEAVARGATA